MLSMMRLRVLFLTPVALLATACAVDRPTATSRSIASDRNPELDAVKFWEAGATVAWNATATSLAATRVIDAGRLYAYLSLAQLRAAEAANSVPGPHPPISAAIGGASVVVLRSFFPLDVAAIEAALDAQDAADPWPGAKHADFAAGEAIGRAVGARVLAFAQGDQETALRSMRAVAEMEDGTEKSAVTPGPLKPAHELLGEMLLELKRPADALKEFEATLNKEPNRFWALYGAARSAKLAGDERTSRDYFRKLLKVADSGDKHGRPELAEAMRETKRD